MSAFIQQHYFAALSAVLGINFVGMYAIHVTCKWLRARGAAK